MERYNSHELNTTGRPQLSLTNTGVVSTSYSSQVVESDTFRWSASRGDNWCTVRRIPVHHPRRRSEGRHCIKLDSYPLTFHTSSFKLYIAIVYKCDIFPAPLINFVNSYYENLSLTMPKSFLVRGQHRPKTTQDAPESQLDHKISHIQELKEEGKKAELWYKVSENNHQLYSILFNISSNVLYVLDRTCILPRLYLNLWKKSLFKLMRDVKIKNNLYQLKIYKIYTYVKKFRAFCFINKFSCVYSKFIRG